MERAEKIELLGLLEERQRRYDRNRLARYKPYPKQAQFHALAKRERMLAAGNQLGKTLAAGAEVSMHLTGRYPDWWVGKRFERPTHWLAGSESGELTRRGVQRILLGPDPKTNPGTGMIPGDLLGDFTWSRSVNELADTIRIKHPSGISSISLKSYDQGRGKWQADTIDGVWFDEEPPDDIYFEGLTRTNVAFGPILVTCTLLKGMTAIASRFLEHADEHDSVGAVNMTIYEAQHYTAEQRDAIIASYPLHERAARTMGVPSMGSGRVFPIEEQAIVIEPKPIPAEWVQLGGMDFGWDHPFAAVCIAWDRDADVIYLTKTYRAREETPIIHAAALKPWGEWLPWAWPHDGLQHDKGSGEELRRQYEAQGLNMLGDRATFEDGGSGVEAGITEMIDRMKTGRFKVFSHLSDWLEEFRMYHRKDGRIVKLRDDLLSATRYALMMKRHAKTHSADNVLKLKFRSQFAR